MGICHPRRAIQPGPNIAIRSKAVTIRGGHADYWRVAHRRRHEVTEGVMVGALPLPTAHAEPASGLVPAIPV